MRKKHCVKKTHQRQPYAFLTVLALSYDGMSMENVRGCIRKQCCNTSRNWSWLVLLLEKASIQSCNPTKLRYLPSMAVLFSQFHQTIALKHFALKSSTDTEKAGIYFSDSVWTEIPQRPERKKKGLISTLDDWPQKQNAAKRFWQKCVFFII